MKQIRRYPLSEGDVNVLVLPIGATSLTAFGSNLYVQQPVKANSLGQNELRCFAVYPLGTPVPDDSLFVNTVTRDGCEFDVWELFGA